MIKIPVLIHLYNTYLWDEIFSLLFPIRDLILLDINISKNQSNNKILSDLRNFEVLKLREMDNKGVDIAPFLFQINELPEQYPYFIKIHSKASLIKNFNWRSVLLHTLLGSRDILLNNIQMIQDNMDIGSIVDKNMIMSNLGHNEQHMQTIADMLNIDIKNKPNNFMAGNIFIGKSQIFKKYITSSFISKIYPLLEEGCVKDEKHGTYCHAMERLFGKIIYLENHEIQSPEIDPSFIIYSQKLKQKFHIYKCYNNYCYSYNDNNLGIVYGKLFNTNDPNLIVMNWNYLSQYQECWKKYAKNKNNIWI